MYEVKKCTRTKIMFRLTQPRLIVFHKRKRGKIFQQFTVTSKLIGARTKNCFEHKQLNDLNNNVLEG